jgi:polypeptide N-acetylgalactosaminyltransferase
VDEGGTTFPSISLIITYINEPRSTLLRTLVSVYERTAPNLLKEIILVDDNNEDKTVGKELKVNWQLINTHAKHW